MRTYYFIIFTFILSGVSLLADDVVPADEPGPPMMVSGNVQGRQYQTSVRISDFTNVPVWTRQEANPPISVREALRLATKGLSKTVGDLKGWHRGNISLIEMSKERWVYQVEYRGPSYQNPKYNFTSDSSVIVFVLMNGRVICPKPVQNDKTPNTALEPTPTAP
jgi:hypothetical protein